VKVEKGSEEGHNKNAENIDFIHGVELKLVNVLNGVVDQKYVEFRDGIVRNEGDRG